MKRQTFLLDGVIILLCVCVIALGYGFYRVWHNGRSKAVIGQVQIDPVAVAPNQSNVQSGEEVITLEGRVKRGLAVDTELVRLADLYFQAGRYDESYNMYKQALSKNGQLVPALQGLANVTRYRGKYEESEQAFMKAIKIQPNNAFLYVDLGKLYRNWDKFSEAEAAFKKALRLDPKNDTLYSYGLGYLYRDEGKFDLAVQSFEKAVSLNPKNDFNYMGLGDIYRDIGEYEKSEVNFKKAISMNPKSESYLGLGYLYLKQNKLPEAEQAFKDYLLLIKPKAEVYSGLGHIYVQQQKYDDAEQMFRKSIELNPTLGGWEALADLFSRQGRASDAVRAREEGQKARQVEGMKQ